MAFQGHHAVDEVHEASRRAIDALMLLDRAKTDFSAIKNHNFYRVNKDSFLHPMYAYNILEKAQKHLDEAEFMPYRY
jgi:hypothetical protein